MGPMTFASVLWSVAVEHRREPFLVGLIVEPLLFQGWNQIKGGGSVIIEVGGNSNNELLDIPLALVFLKYIQMLACFYKSL